MPSKLVPVFGNLPHVDDSLVIGLLGGDGYGCACVMVVPVFEFVLVYKYLNVNHLCLICLL